MSGYHLIKQMKYATQKTNFTDNYLDKRRKSEYDIALSDILISCIKDKCIWHKGE